MSEITGSRSLDISPSIKYGTVIIPKGFKVYHARQNDFDIKKAELIQELAD